MYYQAIKHTSRLVQSAREAATLIYKQGDASGHLRSFDAIRWSCNGMEFCAVADGGLDTPWREVAIIDFKNMIQIESITAAWVDSLDKLIGYFEGAQFTEFTMGKVVNLPIDGKGENTQAVFTCGCCGKGFLSTIAAQAEYDQDEGYGICNSCLNDFFG